MTSGVLHGMQPMTGRNQIDSPFLPFITDLWLSYPSRQPVSIGVVNRLPDEV